MVWILIVAIAVALFAAITIAIALHRRRRVDTERTLEEASRARAVVLAHGFGAAPLGLYFRGIAAELERCGVAVYMPSVSPAGTVPERAAQLAEFVRALPHRWVSIIAHSMGGLDARYAISVLGLSDRVAELVTVGTPHRGSPIADLASRPMFRGARAVASKLGLRSDALDWLTTERLEAFNKEVPDVASVAYFSVVGRAAPEHLWRKPVLLLSHWFLRGSGDSDGLVPVDSQRWGETVAEIDADHWAQTGWSMRFKAADFYVWLLDRLSQERENSEDPAA